MNPRILALDTSSESCSVALSLDGEIIGERVHAPRQHARLILPMLESLLVRAGLKVAQLDAIAFGRGPGSFTGLRIAAGVAQGLAFGANLPVVAISSLSGLALQSFQLNGAVEQLVLIDARMSEVYWSACRIHPAETGAWVESLSGEHVSAAEGVTLDAFTDIPTACLCGSGMNALSVALRQSLKLGQAELEPDARALCQLALIDYAQGKVCSAEQAIPTYVRDEVTWQKLPGR